MGHSTVICRCGEDALETENRSSVNYLKKKYTFYIYFLDRCELSVSITQDKSTPALYGEIQSTNDFPLRRRLARNANYYPFNSRLDSFEFGHLLK